MNSEFALLKILSDGRFHCTAELGASLGARRNGVNKLLRKLTESGVLITAARRRGYRLTESLELLDKEAILACIEATSGTSLMVLDILPDTDSTNLHALRQAALGAPGTYACLAECQRAGRGSRGRSWVSPLGRNIYLSLLWRFKPGAERFAGLSQAVAVAVARALTTLGMADVELKWPNDVLWGERKLAGILIDMVTLPDGACHAVIGVGINVAMPAQNGATIDQPWTDLRGILGCEVSRNRVAGLLLRELLIALPDFENSRLSSFLQEWRARDFLQGKRVSLQTPLDQVSGLVQGIAADGSLIILSTAGLSYYHDGEASLIRAALVSAA